MKNYLYLALIILPTIALGASVWPSMYDLQQQEPQPQQIDDQQLLNLENEFMIENAAIQTNIQMPGATTSKNDTYLCTSYSLYADNTNYLVGFKPITNGNSIHHVLLYGCKNPGSEDLIWDCGEMSHNNFVPRRAPVCADQPNIIYAWAHNAPNLNLPPDVAFRVAGSTKNQFLVLQIHYMHVIDKKDYSGVSVISTSVPQPRTAATLLMVTGGEIKPKSTATMETACIVNEPVEIHPFAFRVHTHRHGTKVQGWVVNEDERNGEDKWTLLGERNPQLPQLFETIKNDSLVVRQGDVLAARCTMMNNENRKIKVGSTGEDEMCNFYLMYWVEGEETLSDNVCYSPGPPRYSFNSEAGLNHIPK